MTKRYFFFLIAITSFSVADAQITLLRSDFGNYGDTLYYGTDTSFAPGSKNIGNGGANQTWNFATGIQADFNGMTIFGNPASDPNAPIGANMGIYSYGGVNTYFRVDSTQVINIRENPLGGPNIENKVMKFPMTYNASFSDSNRVEFKGDGQILALFLGSAIPGIDSAWIKVDIISTNLADGFGSITIPSGTHDVVRVSQKISQKISISGKGILTLNQWVQLNQMNENQFFVTFLAKNQKYYVARAQTDSIGGIENIEYKMAAPSTGLTEVKNPAFKMFPNPASNLLKLDLAGYTGTYQVEIRDLAGKLVLTADSDSDVNVASLETGLYTCTVSGEGFVSSSKLTITR